MHPAVERYIYEAAPAQQKILWSVRALILSLSPKIEEKFSFKVPFYHYHGALCYLNISKKKVYLGFIKGSELQDESGLLTRGDRKMVGIVAFENDESIPYEILRTLLIQSMLLLEEKKSTQKATRKGGSS
jgi:uncharacterized protein